VLFGTYSCQNDDDNDEVITSVQEEVKSFMALDINGYELDTLTFNCSNTYFNTINNIV
jgi:hypothetical protein